MVPERILGCLQNACTNTYIYICIKYICNIYIKYTYIYTYIYTQTPLARNEAAYLHNVREMLLHALQLQFRGCGRSTVDMLVSQSLR